MDDLDALLSLDLDQDGLCLFDDNVAGLAVTQGTKFTKESVEAVTPELQAIDNVDSRDDITDASSDDADVDHNRSLLSKRTTLSTTVSVKRALQLPHDICRVFNKGDIREIASVIGSASHDKCIFRLNDMNRSLEKTGMDAFIVYFEAILNSYPDAVLLLRGLKNSSKANSFRIVKSKFAFSGTMTSSAMLEQYVGAKCDSVLSCLDTEYPPDKIEELMMLEKLLKDRNDLVRYCCRISSKFLFDDYTNKIVVCEISVKLTSFRPA